MNNKSGDAPEAVQEKAIANGLLEELAKYDNVLNNKALAFVEIDLDDGVTVNYAKFEGLVEGV
jgi:hypothetical protein